MSEDIRRLVLEILEQGQNMSLGTYDGEVWVNDVMYVYDGDFNIFWLSLDKTRHSKAILEHSQVAATITISNNAAEENIGLQIEGMAEKIEGDVFEMAKKHRLKRGKPEPEKEGEILDPGEAWYMLKPARIELIYESLFGYEKKVLELT
ncbi:MAG: pyridoxamine 5'-phosphate oxidase family protein [Candidatus Curtissbacteria bacterium]